MASNGGGGWLGGPKKLWSSLTTEVSNIFTEPQHSTNKYDEQRVGQQSQRNFMSEFDQQLQRELSSSASSPQHSRYPSQPYNNSAPSPHYQQQQQIASPTGSWSNNGAADMGLHPSLPAYQQQQLQHIPSGQPLGGDPNYPAQQQQSQPPYGTAMAPAAQPYYPSPIQNTASTPQPLPSSPYSSAPAYPPPSSLPGVGSPTQPAYAPRAPATPIAYPNTNSSMPLSPATPLAVNGAAAPLPYSPQPGTYPATLSPPSTSQPGQHPYAQPTPYPSSPNTYPPHTAAPSSAYPQPPVSAYAGPSYTSAAYSSAGMGALPPPPPSSYWVNRAAQQPATAGGTEAGAVGKVDYSDLDYSSMDFAYARKDR